MQPPPPPLHASRSFAEWVRRARALDAPPLPPSLSTNCGLRHEAFALRRARLMACAPASLQELSADCLEALSAQVALWQRTSRWPSSEQCQITTIIPKADGGLRPIALFRTVVRVVGRVRAQLARDWALARRSPVFNIGGGRRIGDSTWREQMRSLRKTRGVSAEVFVDLKKAFKHVNRNMLLSLAAAQKFPLAVLALSLTSRQWPRRVFYGRCTSGVISASRGIPAGSPFATFELWLYLGPAPTQVYQAREPLPVVLHVDDLSIAARRDDAAVAARDLDQATEAALGLVCSERHMLLANDESFLLIADPTQAPLFAATARKWRAEIVTRAKRLGVPRVLGRVRHMAMTSKGPCSPITLGRFAKAKLRLPRLARLTSIQAATVTRMGVAAVVYYGAEFAAPPARDLAKSLVALGMPLVGVESLSAPAALPEFLVFSAPLIRWRREVWALPTPRAEVPLTC